MATKNQYLKRDDRKGKIFDLFVLISREWMSMYDIAKLLDVAPSMHLRGILDEMVQVGALECREEPYRKNITKRVWRLTEQHRANR